MRESIGAMNFEPIKLAVAVAGWATAGQYALVEACVEAGMEIPAHVARREDVVLHVLRGELDVVVDRERRRRRGRADRSRWTAGSRAGWRRRSARGCWR